MLRVHQPGGTFCGLRSAVSAGSGKFCRLTWDSRKLVSLFGPNPLIAWQRPNCAARNPRSSTLLLASTSTRHDDCFGKGGVN
jgi:hypothetical protein